jgi:hypothetical protein
MRVIEQVLHAWVMPPSVREVANREAPARVPQRPQGDIPVIVHVVWVMVLMSGVQRELCDGRRRM